MLEKMEQEIQSLKSSLEKQSEETAEKFHISESEIKQLKEAKSNLEMILEETKSSKEAVATSLQEQLQVAAEKMRAEKEEHKKDIEILRMSQEKFQQDFQSTTLTVQELLAGKEKLIEQKKELMDENEQLREVVHNSSQMSNANEEMMEKIRAIQQEMEDSEKAHKEMETKYEQVRL